MIRIAYTNFDDNSGLTRHFGPIDRSGALESNNVPAYRGVRVRELSVSLSPFRYGDVCVSCMAPVQS